MDFDRTSLAWSDHDFATFKCGLKGESTVITKLAAKERIDHQTLSTKEEWKAWFKNASFLNPREQTPGLCIVLCNRAEPVFDGVQSPVRYLPFEQQVLFQLVRKFHIHPRITRTIGREICYFSAQHHLSDDVQEYGDDEEDQRPGPLITYTARTSSQLPDDLALSSTFILESGLSLAVIFGCNEKQKKSIVSRMERCDLAYNHPMLLPGLFLELERTRLGDAVEVLLDNFALRGNSDRELDLDMDKERMTAFLKSSYASRDLANQIQAVKRQLGKMMMAMSGGVVDEDPFSNTKSSEYGLSSRAGRQIRVRMEDIAYELDDRINDCHLMMNNMSLTMQTVWNHFARQDNLMNLNLSKVNTHLARTNTGLSQDMKRDSSQMRSIALLTMVFLPLSTVASIFSTTFFNWSPSEGESFVSSYFWVFAVVALALTGIVVGVWYLATRAHHRKEINNNKDKDKDKFSGVFGEDEEKNIGFVNMKLE
ncbi:hypothetical protein B0H63DRAFT_559337 [Podospora didyma]|uniref:Uncharacterized protein n=1 Tax=Podospora didyma TaxID=330526 RepID=A0AAE0NUD5_9PEZI|nr:hypothetical protein B0H63DRAFT_559337 [Podospora didyma]